MTDVRPDVTVPSPNQPGLGPWRSTTPPPGFTPFPDDAVTTSVAGRFLATAVARSEHPALRSPAGSWTYQELSELAQRRASGVRSALPTDRQAPVAVLATHDGPLVVTILSVILAGGILVVLDPLAPAEQLAHVLRESRAELILHDAAQSGLAAEVAMLAGHSGAVHLLDALDHLGAGFEDPATGPDDPIMLAFTSGTSGLPKAAVITNGVLMNLIRGATNALGISPDDRMPMLFPTSLAVAAYPMFLPLLNGGTLATLDVRSVGLAPIADFLATERITLAYMAPTVVRFLVDALAGRTFPDLRMIALGGEVVDAEVVALTTDLLGPERIANGFGTTETGVITLYVLEPDEAPVGVVPAGYPVPGVDVIIVDVHGAQVPTGTSGEVAIATPHLFQGYWGHPELSSQVVSPDPLGRPGWTRYRTGDLGVIDEAGALTVLGRLDTKVKISGRFVVLGDVESSVHGLDEVADACVVATAIDDRTELVAVVAGAPGTPIDPVRLRAQLLEGHEAYRVPTRWKIVEELPRLPNGKVDRQAVASIAEDTAPASMAAPPPTPTRARARGDVEAEVTAIWRLLLPISGFGVDDDFFHLGGHSLLAAQMLVMVEERLGTTVAMSSMVDARTITQVTDVIMALDTAADPDPSTATRVQTGDPARPRLWFVHDLPGSAYRVRHVAEHLGADQPVWSFESPLLRGEPNTYAGLDEFVDRYVTDLLAAQPEGPYWVGGYSFGGICAYQIARRLSALDKEVAFLGVVDVGPGYRGPNWHGRHSPPWPYFGVPYPPPPGASPAAVARHYAAMVRTSPRGALRHLSLRTGLARPIDEIRFRADLRRNGRIRPHWRLWYAWEEHWKLATKAWDRSSPYDGTVHLFWASQTEATDDSMGWDGRVGDLQIHRFPGFHDDLLEEVGAPALATALRIVLDQTIAERADHRSPDQGPIDS